MLNYNIGRCEELIEDIRSEVEVVNVPQVVKKLAGLISKKPSYRYIRLEADPAIVHFLDELPHVETVSEFQELFQAANSEGNRLKLSYWYLIAHDIYSVVPLGMMLKDFEIVENVEFAHSLPKSRAESIEASGVLYGRTSLSRLALTREFLDVYAPNDGFIFAYDLDYHFDENPVVKFSTFLSGDAAYAVKFYFLPDNETQLIIPVRCISGFIVDEWPEHFAPSEGWDDERAELLDPLRWSVGSELSCMGCEEEFTLDEDAIIDLDIMGLGRNQKVLCKQCRPK